MRGHSAVRFVAVLAAMAVAAGQVSEKPKLNILVIGGEGSINNVKQRVAREPIVEVTDENDRPVAGAVVLFRLPNSGASGTFTANQSNVLSVTTGADGRASARFMPNESVGDLQIQVTASYQGVTATKVITMRNVSGAGPQIGKASGGSGKIIAIVAAVGAAAAVGVVAGTRGGNGGGTPPAASPTTITAGGGSVGPRP